MSSTNLLPSFLVNPLKAVLITLVHLHYFFKVSLFPREWEIDHGQHHSGVRLNLSMQSKLKKREAIYGERWWLLIKLDMAKAYDIVECVLLESMMEKLGFNRRWISLLMLDWILTVSYSCIHVMANPRVSLGNLEA